MSFHRPPNTFASERALRSRGSATNTAAGTRSETAWTTGTTTAETTAGATTSVWMESAAIPGFPRLREDTRANVCIIGAGIAGMSAAYMLTRAGKAVVVVDDGMVASGETSRTTGHLTAALDDSYQTIMRLHGEKGARLAAESHMAAIQRIEAITTIEDIDCDFERVDGYLVLDERHKRDILEKELEATHLASLTDVELVTRAPLDTFETEPALRYPRQAQFHPLKYITGLALAITRDGGKIYCGTKATSVEDGEPAIVTTADGHIIVADDVIVATNSPVNDWMVMHTKQSPYRTYVIGLRIPKGSVPKILVWDTATPYHYARVTPGSTRDLQGSHDSSDILIVGGEDHKTGQAHDTDERFRKLESWARRRFPMTEELVYQWSGQVLEPVDGLAFIGRNPGTDRHVYITTGESGNGMTNGTIGGILLTDLIMKRDNPWAKLYDPGRISIRSAFQFSKENLNVAEQYAHWITRGDVGNIDEIPKGSGAVVRRGIHKLAVYKDPRGAVTQCSAVCTHLYCIVDWNDTEKTWDCPCHGSRFDPYGKVINGPAISDLVQVHEDEDDEE